MKGLVDIRRWRAHNFLKGVRCHMKKLALFSLGTILVFGFLHTHNQPQQKQPDKPPIYQQQPDKAQELQIPDAMPAPPEAPSLARQEAEEKQGDQQGQKVVQIGHTAIEIALCLGVLAFGLILIGLEIRVILKSGGGWRINSFRVVGLTLIVIAGLFLITAGYSQNQIASMMALLGTIAGYLLGKGEAGEHK